MAFIGRQYAPLFSNKYDDMMIIPDICNFFRYALSAPPVDNTDIAPPFGVDKTKTAPPCIIMSTQGKDRYIDRFYILMHQLGGGGLLRREHSWQATSWDRSPTYLLSLLSERQCFQEQATAEPMYGL